MSRLLLVLLFAPGILVSQDTYKQMLALSGEAKLIGLLRLVRSTNVDAKTKAMLLSDLESELPLVAFRTPLRLVTYGVVDHEHGYLTNTSFRLPTAQEILIEIAQQRLNANPYDASAYFLEALSDAGKSYSCKDGLRPDLTRIGVFAKTMFSHPSAYIEKRRDYWDGVAAADRCGSLACLNMLLDAAIAIRSKVPEGYRVQLLTKAVSRIRNLRTSERDLEVELATPVQISERASALAESKLGNLYVEGLASLAVSTLNTERCKDLWADIKPEIGMPFYLHEILRRAEISTKLDDPVLKSILSSPLTERMRLPYFWAGDEGARMLETLRHFFWAFKNGNSAHVLASTEQRAALVKFLDDSQRFANLDKWTRTESVMIRSHVLSRSAPLVAGDAALSVLIIDKIDTLFSEVKDNRRLEAVVLGDAIDICREIKAKSPKYSEALDGIAGRIRTPEIDYVIRMNH